MKKKLFLFSSLIILTTIIILAFNFNRAINDNDKKNVLLTLILNGLQTAHYEKKDIDDKLSEQIFIEYLKILDYNKRFFTEEDIIELNKYKLFIDDEINNKTFAFFNLSNKLYKKRILQIERYYKQILSKPFNYSLNEFIEIDPDKKDFPKDSVELYDIWKLSIKYSTIERYSSLLERRDKAKEANDTAYINKSDEELEQEARQKVLKNYDVLWKRLKKLDEDDVFSYYLNAITSAYDPHTEYYPPKDKENFDISMSGKLEGIGATLQSKNGYITIISIVPGSPCWKQGELEVNDKILMAAEKDSLPTDLVDVPVDEAVKYIRGKKGTEVRLTVKKIDGSTKVIPIVRDVVIIEETFAKSVVLTDSISNKKTGYIYIPKFYVDFNNPSGRRSSSDLKKELTKLEKENIDGIIIDLRNNGGGSLPDVVDMVGLFIKNGPVVQIKSGFGKLQILKDFDPRVKYNGKLIIMVNSISASASEIMAAAIQDYNRGIIVGSKRTFGKGTVQRFFNFDDMVNARYNDIKPLGALKITTQKFYRVNGGATQVKGVNADVILPNPYDYIDIGEKQLDNVLPWDIIAELSIKNWDKNYNIKRIRKNSEKRILADTNFRKIVEYSKLLKKEADKTFISLKLSNYIKDKETRNKEVEKFTKIGKVNTSIKASILKDDVEYVNSDTTRKQRFDVWLDNLNKDIYLKETMEILNDMK